MLNVSLGLQLSYGLIAIAVADVYTLAFVVGSQGGIS